MADYTTTELISSIKQTGMIPTSQNTFENPDFLRFLSEELQQGIAPLIMKAREEFFVQSVPVSVVRGTSEYNIPTRAIGGKIRNIYQTIDNQNRLMNRVSIESIPLFNTDGSGYEDSFYIKGSKIVLIPEPTKSSTMTLFYYRRPNRLVLSTACAQVVSVTGNDVVVSSVPSAFTDDLVYDVIENKPPFKSLGDDQSLTISGTTLTFSSAPSGIAAGDWVCQALESPVAQVPYEIYPVLVQRVVLRLLRALGDTEAADRAQSKLNEYQKDTIDLISDRVEGNVRKVINDFSPLKSANYGFGRNFY